jgi:hypothetical protein
MNMNSLKSSFFSDGTGVKFDPPVFLRGISDKKPATCIERLDLVQRITERDSFQDEDDNNVEVQSSPRSQQCENKPLEGLNSRIDNIFDYFNEMDKQIKEFTHQCKIINNEMNNL